jgi:hypothetical protein
MSFAARARARGLDEMAAFVDGAPLTWDVPRDGHLRLADPPEARWTIRLMSRQGPSPSLLARLFGVNQKSGAQPPFDEPLDAAIAASDALRATLWADEDEAVRQRVLGARASGGLSGGAAVDPAFVRGARAWRRVLDIEIDRALAQPGSAPLAVVAAVAERAHTSPRFAAFRHEVFARAEALATARLPTLGLALVDALGEVGGDEALLLRVELALDHRADPWLPDRKCTDGDRERVHRALVALRGAIARCDLSLRARAETTRAMGIDGRAET